jgi:hypothetical protein
MIALLKIIFRLFCVVMVDCCYLHCSGDECPADARNGANVVARRLAWGSE